jgi:hypothetical protein
MPAPLDKDARGSLVSSTAPAVRLKDILPDDVADLTSQFIRAVWVGRGGTVVVQGLLDEAPVTLLNVPDGSLLPIMIRRIFQTGTTATGFVGFI